MQYEAYQKRIGKLARILSGIVRRLPLIVTALAVALTASAAYLLLKGMVLGTSCPPQMRYGEAAAYESRVLFSGFSYEHCAQGEDVWREGTPVTAGKYRVRAVSENAFGKPRFGKPVEVEILPREITVGVTDTALFYGADFSLSGETAQGDRIVCEAFQFRRTSSASGDGLAAQYDVTPDGSRLLILDAQGRDVTGSYRILTQTASVTVTKLRITVTVPDAVKIYDGEKLTSERFEVTSGALCEGDRLVGSFTDSITMFGSVTNAPTFRIFSETGEDVTEYYAPEYVYGKLTVEKRPVAVTTGSLSGVYGGNAFSESSFTVDAEQAPIAGHTVRAVGEAPSFTEAGNHPNLMRFCITDGTGKDVTGNYELLVTAGTVAIAPRPLRVTTESKEWQYDGKPHSADGYTADGLLSGHRFDIFDSFEATDVGEYENEILFEIRDGAGKDVTNNYEIVGNYGVCRITPCPVRIETKSRETVYDGTAHSYYGYTAHGVAQTHNVQIIRATEETEAGVYPNRMEFVIRDAAGRDVTFNYILSVSYGTLTVLPRPLYLTTYGKTWTYDGEHHSHPFYDVSGLADTHGATVAASASAVHAGEIPNVIEMKIFDQTGADVSKNYVTVPTYGTLRIEPRPVTAQTFSGTWTYDSMPHGILGYDVISENGLADGDFLKIESAVTVTDVGTVRNVPTRFTVVGADGSDVSADYAVSWEYGTLEITPRPISLKPADRAKLYDGAPLLADAWEYAKDSEKGIVPWHTAALTYTGERTEIGESESAVVSVRITDGGADVTANYAITAETGRLTVYGEDDAPVGEDGSGNGAPADDGFLDLRADLSADENEILGEVMTETSGALYLRKRSYGDYLKGIWTPGPAYERLLPDGDPYSFLASAALAASGLPARQISFRSMCESLLPTYPALGAMGGAGPTDDVSAGKLPASYTLPYYAPSAYPNPDGLVGRLGAYEAYEAMYAHEVSQNYLFVDGETRAYLEGVIREEGYSLSDPYVIKKIALYVRNAAEYRLDYDRAMDGEENIVVAFLEQYRQGDCRHFASAAVLLYRALGIPARYVEGYRVQAAADGYVPITGADAHAWAEVFDARLGWIPVEATPPSELSDDMDADDVIVGMMPIPGEETTAPEPSLPEQTETTEIPAETADITEPADTVSAAAPADTEHVPDTDDPSGIGGTGSESGTGSGGTGTSMLSAELLHTFAAVLAVLLCMAALVLLMLFYRSARKRSLDALLYPEAAHRNASALRLYRRCAALASACGEALPAALTTAAEKARFSRHTLTEAEHDQFRVWYQAHCAVLQEHDKPMSRLRHYWFDVYY